MKKTLSLIFFVGVLLFLPLSSVFATGHETVNDSWMMYVTWIGWAAAIIFAIILTIGILKKDEGTDKMKEISKAIQEGALAYLKQQYKAVAIFFAVVFALLLVLSYGLGLLSVFAPYAFLSGGFFSALAGFIGMAVATRANSRTAHAVKESLNSGLRVAFSSGTIMGMSVVGLGLLNIAIWWVLL